MPESYPFLRIEDEFYGIVYTFSTEKFGYTAYFNNSAYADLVAEYEYLSEKSYSFGFFNKDLAPEIKNARDENVSYTIIKIVEEFFDSEGLDSIILFHCDVADKRQYSRHKTFATWYKNSHVTENIIMHSLEVDVLDTKHYLGFICHTTNEHLPQLMQEFETVAQKLTPNNGHKK